MAKRKFYILFFRLLSIFFGILRDFSLHVIFAILDVGSQQDFLTLRKRAGDSSFMQFAVQAKIDPDFSSFHRLKQHKHPPLRLKPAFPPTRPAVWPSSSKYFSHPVN